MPLRILIVPDKFKGTLTAHAAASAIAAGWRQARPDDHLELLPMSDGGDGFGAVMGELLHAKEKVAKTINAAHQPMQARWWHSVATKTAVIDSAEIIGLATLPKRTFHPFQLDGFGLGQVMKATARVGARHGYIGIGGSATNDAGFGMARALGWKFYDAGGTELTEWWQLRELSRAQPPAKKLNCRFKVAVDVSNPLLGPRGCSRIYGPQKGLRPQDIPLAEQCLSRLVTVLQAQQKIGNATAPGAGAAGGLGFGLAAFAGAAMESGFELFARISELEKRIRKADLVITGEGQIDPQTYMGKGVGQIARRCAGFGVPCLAVAGAVLEPEKVRRAFVKIRALTEITTPARALAGASRHLQQLARQVATTFGK